jgi:hypothetical protein
MLEVHPAAHGEALHYLGNVRDFQHELLKLCALIQPHLPRWVKILRTRKVMNGARMQQR